MVDDRIDIATGVTDMDTATRRPRLLLEELDLDRQDDSRSRARLLELLHEARSERVRLGLPFLTAEEIERDLGRRDDGVIGP